jgi:HSP20 family protein
MSNLVRFDPFSELLAMQRQLDRVFGTLSQTAAKTEESDTALDMYETDTDVIVQMAVAGFKPEDIQVTLTGDTLSIKGEVKSEHEDRDEKRSYIRREIRRGSFQRVVSLPVGVKGDDTTAEFKNGLLVLTIPKAEETKPKTIQIKAK